MAGKRQSGGERSRKTKARLVEELEALDRRVQELESANGQRAGADSGGVPGNSDDSRDADNLQTILSSLDHGVTLFDANLELITWNEQWLKLAQFPRDLARPKTPLIDMIEYNARRGVLGHDDPDEHTRAQLAAYKTMAAETDSAGKRFERRYPDGAVTEIRADRTPGAGLVITHTDITALKQREEALRQSEARAEQARTRLQDAMDAMPAGVLLCDADDRVVSFNAQYTTWFPEMSHVLVPGTHIKELVKYWIESGHPIPDEDDRDMTVEERLELFRNPRGPRLQVMADGRWQQLIDRKLADGGTVRIRVDVTELKRAEQELTRHRDRLEDLVAERTRELAEKSALLEATFESISEGFALFDADDRLVFCNENYIRFAQPITDMIKPGVTYETLVRGMIEGGHAAHIGNTVEAKVRARLAKHRNPHGNHEVELGDGRWMLITERRTGDGGIALVQTDISEMKKADALIAASEDRLKTILASSPFGAGVSRITDGTILYINERAAARVGLAPEDMVGTTVAGNWVNSRDRDRFREILERDGRVEGTEVELKRADGSRYWSLLSWDRIPLFGEDTVVFWSYDISELKEAQENMRLAKESADAANRAKSDFLSNMSHELRTPMNAILGFSQILDSDPEHPLDEVQRGSNRHILKAGEHLLVLINEVLDLVRVESGGLSLSIEDVEPATVIESCVTLARTLADKRGIELTDRTAGRDLPNISADFTRCKQVLLNLLSNAVKYNRPGGRIVVDAERTDDAMLRLSVADTGLGIAAEAHGEIFEPFTRLKTASHGDVEGSGIGLTITKRLVEMMGGRIGLQSALGQGSLFWIELPLAKSVGAAPKLTAAPTAAAVDETPAAAPAARTMLYVEDNPASVLLMERIVERVGHLELLCAHTAELGLEIAEARQPDLILMDINLPGMSGIEAMARLRANPDTREIPVIGLSANAMPNDIKHGLAAGFRRYLTKPIRIAEILEAIDAVTRGEADSS